MALPGVDGVWRLFRRVDDVFQRVDKAVVALDRLADEVRTIERRVALLEAREELLVEKARTASAVAASGAVTTHLVEMSRRIGVLEAMQDTRNRLE